MSKDNYVKLYRGLANTKPEDVSTGRGLDDPDYPGVHDSVGIHWTPDFDIAKNFATNRDYGGPRKRPVDEGVVLEAMVHKRHLIDYNSDEGQRYASAYHIEEPDEDSDENETTVRRRAPVLIIKKHHLVGQQFKTETPDIPVRAKAQ